VTPHEPTPSGAPLEPVVEPLAAPAVEPAAELSERQQAMLEFERTWWTINDSREQQVRARFSCSTEDYYHELNQLLDHPGALAFDPLVVRRLRRQRERRRRARIDGPNGVGTATGRDR